MVQARPLGSSSTGASYRWPQTKGLCFKTLKDHPQLGIEQAFLSPREFPLQKKDAVVWIGLPAFLTPPSNGCLKIRFSRYCLCWVGAEFWSPAMRRLGGLLVGMLQIAVICLVIGPLQKWKPVEPVVNKAAVRVDVLYTLIHRLGCSVSQSFSADTSWTRCLVRFASLASVHCS